MLACLQRGSSHGEMQGVGGANVNGIDLGIGEEFPVIAGGALDRKFVGEAARLIQGSGGDACDLNIAETPNALGVNQAP